MKRRYYTLRFIAGVYQALAVLAVLATLYFIVTALGGTGSNWLMVPLAAGIAVLLFSIGEAIDVFLGIEENTRRQADAMDRWTGGPPPP